MPVPWLIDTDPGIDDALALLLAFASPEVSVEAITSVAGNVPVDFATANVHRILSVGAPAAHVRTARAGRPPRSGAPSSRRPISTVTTASEASSSLRAPGGQRLYPAPEALTGATTGGAAGIVDGPDLILEMADRFAGELVVVALGPLTNLAVALERGGRRLSKVRRIVIMGGAVAVPGNVTRRPSSTFMSTRRPPRPSADRGFRWKWCRSTPPSR